MNRFAPIVFALVLIPQIALAAWWNPVSWFAGKNPDQEREQLLDRLYKLEEKINLQSTTTPETLETEPIQKAEIKTVIADNPKLQSEINALLRQNSELVSKNNELTIKYNSLISQFNQCRADSLSSSTNTSISVTSTADQEREQKLLDLDEKMMTILDGYLDQMKGYGDASSVLNYSSLKFDSINQLLKSYRLVDSKIEYDYIKPTNSKEEQWKIAKDLKSYLKNIYIPYRQ